MSRPHAPSYIVLDAGGTTLRIGSYELDSGRVVDVSRHPMANFLARPNASVAELQAAVMVQLLSVIAAQQARRPALAVGISFAGPIDADGKVVNAPTIWGKRGAPLDLGRQLSEVLELPVHVLNDVSAAAWRYAGPGAEPFCLTTVSSGIGNKVFYDGQVLVNRFGYGGEIGHMRVDFADDALPCDCGGVGHLGAYASGRGAVTTARRFAQAEPAAFAASQLGRLCLQDSARISAEFIVAAVDLGDDFALRCVRVGIRHMAQAVSGIYAAIGVRRYLFMGGFAQALGQRYLDEMAAELRAMGLFGVAPEQIASMLEMASPDDDHGLVGAGHYLRRLGFHHAEPVLAA
jgi:predicted NBD/HSP70 family sugar kinase